jgi:hypothetical protein
MLLILGMTTVYWYQIVVFSESTSSMLPDNCRNECIVPGICAQDCHTLNTAFSSEGGLECYMYEVRESSSTRQRGRLLYR